MLLTIPNLIAQAAPNVRRIDAAAAFAECQGNGGLILDVREPGEVSGRPVAGSLNIPRGVLEMKLIEVCADADKPIYLHCATGGRAVLAAEQLQRMGYSSVSAISCGLDDVCKARENSPAT